MKLSLNSLKHYTFKETYEDFLELYEKTLEGERLTDEEKISVLAIAVIFANQDDVIVKNLGYRIVLAYGNSTLDYLPLFDVSLNFGLIPVTSKIDEFMQMNNQGMPGAFNREMIGSVLEFYEDSGIRLTEQQYLLNLFFSRFMKETATVIAPTSYGVSDHSKPATSDHFSPLQNHPPGTQNVPW